MGEQTKFSLWAFCGIYGLGAVIMILCLHKSPKKFNTLFVDGAIVGAIVEYAIKGEY